MQAWWIGSRSENMGNAIGCMGNSQKEKSEIPSHYGFEMRRLRTQGKADSGKRAEPEKKVTETAPLGGIEFEKVEELEDRDEDLKQKVSEDREDDLQKRGSANVESLRAFFANDSYGEERLEQDITRMSDRQSSVSSAGHVDKIKDVFSDENALMNRDKSSLHASQRTESASTKVKVKKAQKQFADDRHNSKAKSTKVKFDKNVRKRIQRHRSKIEAAGFENNPKVAKVGVVCSVHDSVSEPKQTPAAA